ncbi:hypothetical protein F7725_010730 [Dissostichus mawsoni]|uniref:MULE transposase domain-containing protein n=1 Tax=Dissostichus mawsoni TaxID=36200 RepID=A0A7J5XPF8_DISMA|nr:hypothetical protein F7725_010730 [Dissostichus mawsoni]
MTSCVQQLSLLHSHLQTACSRWKEHRRSVALGNAFLRAPLSALQSSVMTSCGLRVLCQQSPSLQQLVLAVPALSNSLLVLRLAEENAQREATCTAVGQEEEYPAVLPSIFPEESMKHSSPLFLREYGQGELQGIPPPDPSCAGGLPLGILLCQSEDEQTIAQGLEQLKQVVGEKGFAGRGHEGPQLVITDDCRAERGALRKAFPKATLLLCSFHLLQAVWRWLWSKESCCTQEVRRWLKTAFIFWAPYGGFCQGSAGLSIKVEGLLRGAGRGFTAGATGG